MNVILRNILAVVLGVALGGAVNMLIVVLGPFVIPPPPGVDVTDTESIAASMHLFGPIQFVVPFLAHAIGTLVGAIVAFLVAGSYQRVFAYVIGAFFLVGGITVSFMIPAPGWFVILDLVGAYVPMAWLATKIGAHLKN